jgi:hypothetical protein
LKRRSLLLEVGNIKGSDETKCGEYELLPYLSRL